MPGMAIHKVMWVEMRARTFAFFLLAVLVAASIGVLIAVKPAHAATFAVNSTGNARDANLANAACDVNASASGNQCTLRAAIQEANDTDGADVINFNIPDNPNVAGFEVKTISPATALPIITEQVTINGYTQSGASPNTLATGNDARLKVQLNGTNAGSGVSGLTINASNSTIRGLVINRFRGGGILVEGSLATGNRIEGNFIGTNASGSTDLGTFLEGVIISGAPDNTIGGTEPRERNVLSGSSRGGVLISGAEATRNRVEGNYIGTDATGTADLGNNQIGVRIGDAADDNTVGGTTRGTRNVISGTGGDGVFIGTTFPTPDLATGNEVLGNFIGTRADGTGDLGNDNAGVTISLGTSNTTVGGTARAAGNRIAHNGEDGVSIFSSVGNSVLSNQIFSNGSTANDLGIDLDFDGVAENDPDDPDAGSNNKQNFPVITSVIQSTALLNPTRISGRLNSTPEQEFTIQCFLADEPADPSGHGEGRGFMAADTTVTTNANGNATFECNFLFPQPLEGKEWSATATDEATGDTSEFSANFTVPVE
jgi:hypothetical protein